MYRAVYEKQVDVISGYSTDGRINAYDLKILEDDHYAFPPYYCTPILRQETANQYPDLVKAISLLSGQIDDAAMTAMNYQVDFEKKSPDEVATTFLKDVGLWKPDRQDGGETIVLASKIFTEQYILVALFAQLIDGYTDLDVEVKPGLGGTKICFDALLNGEVDMYAEYTGTGLQVLLDTPPDVVRSIIADNEAVYTYVKEQFHKEYNLIWLDPLGFNNTYALMMRAEQADRLGIEKISDLRK
jgi:osmoprotectant transport system permease protein